MTRVNLDAPEHELCSSAMRDASRVIDTLRKEVAARQADLSRSCAENEALRNRVVADSLVMARGADEVDKLRAENERLRAALVDCAHAGCPTAAESIAMIEAGQSESAEPVKP